MNYLKYQHIVKLGSPEVTNIQFGVTYVFPKLDGTNSIVYYKQDALGQKNIAAGSRNRELSLDNDNAGFYSFISQSENMINFVNENQNLIIYGEWLVPHTLRTYVNTAWRKFYIFDVVRLNDDGSITYLPYEEYLEMFDNENFKNDGIEVIPPLAKITNGSDESYYKMLEKNTYLLPDQPDVYGEGIVIKNYNYVNRFGHTIWAKIVRNDFKANNHKVFGPPEIENKITEQKIIEMAITAELLDKEIWKILMQDANMNNTEIGVEYNIMDFWDRKKHIPKLFGIFWYTILTEELPSIIIKLKNPTINFKVLHQFMILKLKALKPQLF